MTEQTDRDAKKAEMKEWFLRHYEDPVHNTPYDSGEGGYIFIWGGPHDAHNVLNDEFSSEVDEDIIQEAAKELEQECIEWTRIPTLEDFEPKCGFSDVGRFCVSLSRIKEQTESIEGTGAGGFMATLLFAHTITCFEVYLADAFLTCIKRDKYFRTFVETDPELSKEKLSVSEIFKKMETLETDATKRLQSISFHNLAVVQRMYKATLGIELPPGMKDLLAAISKRHDIVHRNCKTKEGMEFTVTKEEVLALVNLVDRFVTELNAEVEKALA